MCCSKCSKTSEQCKCKTWPGLTIQVDTTQLDEAISKAEKLVELLEKADQLTKKL